MWYLSISHLSNRLNYALIESNKTYLTFYHRFIRTSLLMTFEKAVIQFNFYQSMFTYDGNSKLPLKLLIPANKSRT